MGAVKAKMTRNRIRKGFFNERKSRIQSELNSTYINDEKYFKT